MSEPIPAVTLDRWRLQVNGGRDLDPVQAQTLLEEVERMRALNSTPELMDFWEGAKREAIHQRDRWGDDHDISKSPAEWVALLVHLLGKCIKAYWDADEKKVLHHIITAAAVCTNWHARITGRENDGRMHRLRTHT